MEARKNEKYFDCSALLWHQGGELRIRELAMIYMLLPLKWLQYNGAAQVYIVETSGYLEMRDEAELSVEVGEGAAQTEIQSDIKQFGPCP